MALAVSAASICGGAHADVLVSNIGQTPETDFDGGTDTPAVVYPGQLALQTFRTGYGTDIFVLTSVELSISNLPDHPADMVVSIYSARRVGFDWVPDDEVHTLENPESFSIGSNAFEAPDGATLDAETRYFVRVSYAHGGVTPNLHDLVLNITESNAEDEAQDGWSIANAPSASASYGNAPYMIRINGGLPKPVVTDVSVTSQPHTGDTYGRSETIEVQVTFDREVRVSGRPVVSLQVGGNWRGARYVSGSGGKVLTFQYVVASDDTDADGISIHASDSAGTYGLVGDGSKITDKVSGTLADRAYGGRANLPGHKVDGTVLPIPVVTDVSVTSQPRVGDTYGRSETIEVQVTVQRASLRSRLGMHVMPVGDAEADFGGRRAAALVLLVDPAHRPRIDAQRVAVTLGLTTSEGRMAALLAEGLKVREIAAAQGWSENYVRWLLKQVYRKQGVSGQVALVRHVLAADALPPR